MKNKAETLVKPGRPKSEFKDIARIQAPLVRAINEKIAESGQTIRLFAQTHDLPYSMLTSVLSNTRWVANSDKELVVKPLAKMLGVTVVDIYNKSGLLDFSDFIDPQSLEEMLELARHTISKDKTINIYLPKKDTWDSWPIDAKVSLVLFYQMYAQKQLLKMASIDIPAVIKRENKHTGSEESSTESDSLNAASRFFPDLLESGTYATEEKPAVSVADMNRAVKLKALENFIGKTLKS